MIELEQLQKYKGKVSDEAYIAILDVAMRANIAIATSQREPFLYQAAIAAAQASQALAHIKAIVGSSDAQTNK